jgi:hypothetical protein
MATMNSDLPKRLSRAENARFVINWLNEHGFTVKAGCRLLKMHDLLQEAQCDCETPEFWIALESLRDLVELGFILEQLGHYAGSPKVRGIIKNLLYDKPLPQNDRETNSRGRDTHWELYLAAICQSAGMTPIGFAGNDVTCTVDGTLFGIEAKRIKSENSAKKRIKKAIDQLINAKRPGVVAVDMSLAWNERNRPITGSIHNAFIDMKLDAQVRQFFDRHKGWIEERCIGKGVLAVVVFNFVMRLREDKWRPHRHAMWFAMPQTQKERELCESFRTQFCSVTPNRKDTIDGE